MLVDHLRYLIVGGDGIVSLKLHEQLILTGATSYLSTRSKSDVCRARPFLDVHNCASPQMLPSVEVVIVTAFVTNYEKCAKEPRAIRFNLIDVPNFIEFMLCSGYRVIFISSNAVFPSSSFFPGESSHACPANSYGEQKLRVEGQVMQFARQNGLAHRLTVLRCTKILDRFAAPVSHWTQSWDSGIPSFAYTDSFVAPISVKYLSQIIVGVSSADLSGLVHVSGASPISYWALSQDLALTVQQKSIDVQKAIAPKAPWGLKCRFGGLGTSVLHEKLGVKPLALRSFVEDLSA